MSRFKSLYKDRYRRKRSIDPVFADVEWIVTATYSLVTSRGSVECVRMRAVISNAFCIHLTVEYLKKHFVKIPEKCFSWRDMRRCQKEPDHKGAHRYDTRPVARSKTRRHRRRD